MAEFNMKVFTEEFDKEIEKLTQELNDNIHDLESKNIDYLGGKLFGMKSILEMLKNASV